MSILQSISEAIFRANPDFELVLFDRLPSAQQKLLSSLQADLGFYGILRPRQGSSLGTKTVSQDTALLYLTLQDPGKLPSYVKALCGHRCNQTIAELVLDGVLEIECDGTFVSGANAYRLIYGEKPMLAGGGAIARLSIEAVKYAQALDIIDAAALSARLYFYHRYPASPHWRRRFPTPDAVAKFLRLHAGESCKTMLDAHWIRMPLPPPDDAWLMWRSRHRKPSSRISGPTYKLYVSPDCEAMPGVFQTVVEIFSESPVPCFKVGKDIPGLLRPDKLVAYFGSLADLLATAELLRGELDGCPTHGVPFTAEIAGDGLFSWGLDPPRNQRLLRWRKLESWRQWVTNRLAVSLLMTRTTQPKDVEPWQFALERVQMAGVDVESWIPTPELWYAAPTEEG